MNVSISKKKLDELEKSGAVVRGRKKPVMKQAVAPKPSPVNSADSGAQVAIVAAQVLSDISKKITETLDRVQAPVQRPASAYTFTINRDKNGFMSTVVAKPHQNIKS